jgi:hypothetical protein
MYYLPNNKKTPLLKQGRGPIFFPSLPEEKPGVVKSHATSESLGFLLAARTAKCNANFRALTSPGYKKYCVIFYNRSAPRFEEGTLKICGQQRIP